MSVRKINIEWSTLRSLIYVAVEKNNAKLLNELFEEYGSVEMTESLESFYEMVPQNKELSSIACLFFI